MTDHVYEILADRNDAKANFLFDWSADILLNPGRKPGVVPVLRGDEGSGKSVYAGVTRRILGAKNVLTTSDADRILGRFAAVANKILVVGEEVLFAGNKSQNDKLKHLITGDTIQVEVKFGDPLEIESCHRLMLLSNHEHVLNVGANARRIVMYEVPSTKVGDDKYFDPLQDMAKGRDEATVGMFMRFLLDRDLSSFRPWKSQRALAGDTALVKQKQLSLPPPLLWLREVVDVIDGQQAQPTGYNTATSWVKHYSWSDGGLLSAWPPAFPRVEAVNAFRNWAKETKPYGASEFTSSPERFWTEIHKVIPLAQTQRKVHSVRMVTIDLADLESNFQKYLEGKPV